MRVSVSSSGSFKRTQDALLRMQRRQQFAVLNRFGTEGVAALSAATPVEDGETAQSWVYEIVSRPGYYAIHWSNTNSKNGIPVAVVLQYGHATRSGSWVEGRDYINPAMRPIFDRMANEMWKEVTK